MNESENRILKWKQENCKHKVIKVNPITDDPIRALLRCVRCGKEERVYIK